MAVLGVRVGAVALLGLWLGLAPSLLAGVLDEARSAVRAESSSSGPSDWQGGNGGHGCYDDDCNPGAEILAHVIGAMLEGMCAPRCDSGPIDGHAPTVLNDYHFLRFPYDHGEPGYLISEASFYNTPPTPLTASQLAAGEVEAPPPPMPAAPPLRAAAVRLWFDYGNDFDDLERWRGEALLQTSAGAAFEAEWNTYIERMPTMLEQIHVGEVNFLSRFAATETSQWMWGFGLAWLDDPTETNLGYNLTLKADFFPRKPFVFSGEIDYGEIGRAHVFHAAATVGVLYRRYEIFGGYDYRNIESAELQGPMFGVRIWY